MSTIARRLVKVGTGTSAYYDITGGHGLLNFAQGDEAVLQLVSCELRFFLGEWFLDIARGVPWVRNPNSSVQTILGRFPADLAYAEVTIKAAILRIDGVHSVDSFALDFNHTTRAATCTVHGTLDSGNTFTVSEAPL